MPRKKKAASAPVAEAKEPEAQQAETAETQSGEEERATTDGDTNGIEPGEVVPQADNADSAEATAQGSDEAEAGAGSKRSAPSEEGEEGEGSPDRPRRRQKSGWDSQEAPSEAAVSRESSTPARSKPEAPAAREGDWVRPSQTLLNICNIVSTLCTIPVHSVKIAGKDKHNHLLVHCLQACPGCGANCFQSKTSCFKCHAPRPGFESENKPRLVLPHGWLECAAVGDPIAAPNVGAGFLPMKVPLSEEFSDEKLCQTPVTPDKIHTPKDFLKKQAEQFNRKVGMVVDLTFTHKYYDGKKEFEAEGVEYLKIMTQGGGTELPKKADLEIFSKKVLDFFKSRPEELCAVHCTHGINRSGFFIVTFLVEQCKLSVKEALASFAAARQPGIWDHLFIDELYARHLAGVRPGPEAYPAIPPWSKEKRRRDYDERRYSVYLLY